MIKNIFLNNKKNILTNQNVDCNEYNDKMIKIKLIWLINIS